MVANTGSSNGPSFTSNDKNQTTAINSNSYTYSGPSQTERVQLNSTTDAYSGLGLSYETTSSGTTYYTRCSCGMLVNERLPNGSKYYYLFDGLGSIVGLTNSSSSEVNAYDYDPYGVILNETTPQPNPFQYAGGYFESSTGLVKFGTRYYNPALGRWTQQDPVGGSLGSPDSLNRYLYVADDPVNLVDPSGDQVNVFGILGCIGTVLLTLIGFFSGIALTLSIVAVFVGFLGGLNPLAALPLFIIGVLVFTVVVAALGVASYDIIASQCGLPAL